MTKHPALRGDTAFPACPVEKRGVALREFGSDFEQKESEFGYGEFMVKRRKDDKALVRYKVYTTPKSDMSPENYWLED